MKYILLIFSALYFFSFSALAQTFYCERMRLDASGFSNKRVASSWFNESVTITADLNQKTATYRGTTSDLYIRDDKKRLKVSFIRKASSGRRIALSFVFLANGEVHSNISAVGGFKSTGGAVYKCSGWNGSL